MPDSKFQSTRKNLHNILEDEFQQLVDIIEQKQILHESIEILESPASPPEWSSQKKIELAANTLTQHSRALGAETLAEYFHALENDARAGNTQQNKELLQTISQEFEKMRNILSNSED